MKRLWFSAFLLTFLLAVTLWNVSYLGHFTAQVTTLLSDAEVRAESGDWAGAEAVTKEAKAIWESRTFYLYSTLFHSDTDKVYVGFREVLELIYSQQDGDYSAANARLIAELDLLHKMNEFSFHNIL